MMMKCEYCKEEFDKLYKVDTEQYCEYCSPIIRDLCEECKEKYYEIGDEMFHEA